MQRTNTYDPFNRLIAIRKKSTNLLVAQYFYDTSGERAATIAYNSSGAAVSFTQYLREGSQVVYEKTWTLPGWTVQGEKWYLYGQGKMAVTKETVSGQTTLSYYATDHLGTVRAVVGVDASGMEKTRSFNDYEPYGLEIVPLQVSSHTHRYTGHERDVLDALSGTTLDYMHFRSYASATGRFTRPDNVWGTPASPQSWNLYAYVKGNPVKFNDPTGHSASDPKQQSTKGQPHGLPTPASADQKKQREEMWLAYERLKQMGNLSRETLSQAAKQLLSVLRVGNNPVSQSLGDQLTTAVQDRTGAWKGHEGAKAAVDVLQATGTAVAIKELVTSSTAAIQAETATQAAIAAAGGSAEAVSTGFLGSGLTTGTGLGLAGVSFFAGVTVGNVAREHLIPESANETYGEVLQTATDYYGWSDWIANRADQIDRILP